MSPLSYAYLVEININFKQEVYVMTTVTWRDPVRTKLLAFPEGTTVVGLAVRTGHYGVVRQVKIRVKNVEYIHSHTKEVIRKTFRDTYIVVEWDDAKISKVPTSKVINTKCFTNEKIQSLILNRIEYMKVWRRRRRIKTKLEKRKAEELNIPVSSVHITEDEILQEENRMFERK